MSISISSAVPGAGFPQRETGNANGRAVGGTPANTPPPVQDTVDIVQTGQSGEGANNNSETFFQQSPERYGLAGNRTQYAIDLDSQEVIIKVVDPTTQKELRQIPSPEARKLAKQIEAYQSQAFNL